MLKDIHYITVYFILNQNSGIEIIKYSNSLNVTNFHVSLAVEYNLYIPRTRDFYESERLTYEICKIIFTIILEKNIITDAVSFCLNSRGLVRKLFSSPEPKA